MLKDQLRYSTLFALSVVALSTIAPQVAAQTAANEAEPLGEVIVTARRVEENQQDIPIAVTAFSGAKLEERQIFITSSLDQLVPNLQFANNAPLAGNNSSSAVFIRGIGQTDPTSTVDPGVGLYVDDVYIGNAVGATMTLMDVGSIQVLRGPQGTLFGRNTIGGAVLITSQEPGDDFGGEINVGGGSDTLIEAFAALDTPFSDTMKARFTAGSRSQDGYVLRPDGTDLGDTNTWTATAKLVWKPTDAITAKLGFDYTNSDEHGSPLVFAAINEAATFPRVASQDAGCPGVVFPMSGNVPMIDDPRCANDFQNAGPYKNNGTFPLKSTLENWGAYLNLSLGFGDALTLKSITSIRDIKWGGIRDADNTPLTILNTTYDVDASQWSQELQLIYDADKLTGVAGLYYFAQESTDIVTVDLNPPPPGVQHDSDNNKVDNDSWAAFTQWTFHLNDAIAFTAGGRYTEETKRSYPDQFDYATPNIKQVPVMWYEDTFDAFTASGSAQWRFSDAAMMYVSYSEGFKGGGWNSHFNAVLTAPQQAALHEFLPEEAQTIELGFKLDLASRTLRLNGAIFTSDYTDMQLTYRGPAPAGVAPFVTNAGQTSIDGAELELLWAPVPALNVEASIGYLDASIDELDNIPLAVLPPGLVEGNALPYAPEWQGHVGLSYAIHAGSIDITPRVDASYQDTTFFDATDTPEIAQLDAVTVLNASVFLGPADGPWRITIGVNNATDELYQIAGNSSLTTGSGYAETAYARPREYFASIKFEF